MKTMRQIATIVAIGFIAAAATRLVVGPAERELACDPAAIPADEICLQSIPDHIDIVWVDARSREDWQRNGLPGSSLWNLDPHEDMQAFEMETAMRVALHPHVIVYCDDEHCGTSRQIAQRIRDLDLGAEVHVLHGGWRALSEAGLTPDPRQTP